MTHHFNHDLPGLRSRLARRLVTVEHREPDADVLIVTNAWPVDDENAGPAGHGLLLRNSPSRPRDGARYGIFAKRQVGSLLDAGLRCDVVFIRGFASALAYPVAAVALWRLTRARRPRYTVIHGHGGETLLPLLFCSRAPRIVSFCGDDLLGTPTSDGSLTRRSRRKRRLLSFLSRFTSATITKSRQMQGALPDPVRKRNHVLPNGVDRQFFHPVDRSAARRRLGWPPLQLTALFAADPAVPRKRYELARAACDEARRRGVDVRLEIATDLDPLLMPAAMGASDLLLMTSSIEGSPNVVKEAIMCNLPVVATDVGDVRELLKDVHPSYVCAPTQAAIGEAIVDCVQRGQRSNGREVGEWLDERMIASRLISIYEAVAGGLRRASTAERDDAVARSAPAAPHAAAAASPGLRGA